MKRHVIELSTKHKYLAKAYKDNQANKKNWYALLKRLFFYITKQLNAETLEKQLKLTSL